MRRRDYEEARTSGGNWMREKRRTQLQSFYKESENQILGPKREVY